MKKKIILSILAVITFPGCTKKPDAEIQPKEGKLTVSEATGSGPEWCKGGTSGKFSSNSPASQGSFDCVVKGLITVKESIL